MSAPPPSLSSLNAVLISYTSTQVSIQITSATVPTLPTLLLLRPIAEPVATMLSRLTLTLEKRWLKKAKLEAPLSFQTPVDTSLSHRAFWTNNLAMLLPAPPTHHSSIPFGVFLDPPHILSATFFNSNKVIPFVGVPLVPTVTATPATAHLEFDWSPPTAASLPHYTPTPADLLSPTPLSVTITPISASQLRGIPVTLALLQPPTPIPALPILSLRHLPTPPPPQTLRLFTYNLLADLYTSQKTNKAQFAHTTPTVLSPARRFPLLIAEIIAHNASLIFLQEVDQSIFTTFLLPILSTLNYSGRYLNKISKQREGLAVFWRGDALTLEHESGGAVKDLFRPNEKSWESMDSVRSFSDQHEHLREVMMENVGTVAQFFVFKDRERGGKFVVANTHLFFHPLADHVRAMQLLAVCKRAGELKVEYGAAGVIVGGDLNSDPESGAARLMRGEEVVKGDDCWKDFRTMVWNSEREYEMESSGGDGGVDGIDSLSMDSSFPKMIACTGRPEFTNYTTTFVDTLDYIYVNEDAFEVVGVFANPSLKEMEGGGAMPNESFASDHISLCADVKLK